MHSGGHCCRRRQRVNIFQPGNEIVSGTIVLFQSTTTAPLLGKKKLLRTTDTTIRFHGLMADPTPSNATSNLNQMNTICDIVETQCESILPTTLPFYLIIVTYLVVFLPWATIALFDFINERWSPVGKIWVRGFLQLFFTFVPIPFAIYYINWLIVAEDYTEMCTAIVALCLSIYHFCRTSWGIIQIFVLKRWIGLWLQIMHFQGYHLFSDPLLEQADDKMRTRIVEQRNALNPDTERKHADGLLLELTFPRKTYYHLFTCSKKAWNRKKLVRHLVHRLPMNSSIVDNEVLDMENPFSINLNPFQRLKPFIFPKFPEHCFLRWSVLFLSYFGIPFLQDSLYTRSLLNRMETPSKENLFVKSLVTQAMLIGNVSETRDPQHKPTWESTWSTILLCRSAALYTAAKDSTCTPGGHMSMNVQHGLYFERYAHRLCRLIDSLPPERVDLRSSEQGSNWNEVNLLNGVSHLDIENFLIFLQSSPLHDVNHISDSAVTTSTNLEETGTPTYVKRFFRFFSLLGRGKRGATPDIESQENRLPARSANTIPAIMGSNGEAVIKRNDQLKIGTLRCRWTNDFLTTHFVKKNFWVKLASLKFWNRSRHKRNGVKFYSVFEQIVDYGNGISTTNNTTPTTTQSSGTQEDPRYEQTLILRTQLDMETAERPTCDEHHRDWWEKLSDLAVFKRMPTINTVDGSKDVLVINVIIDNIFAIVFGNRVWQSLKRKGTNNVKSTFQKDTELKKANCKIQTHLLDLEAIGNSERGVESIKDVQFSGSSMKNVKEMFKILEEREEPLAYVLKKSKSRTETQTETENIEAEIQAETFEVSHMLRNAAMIAIHKREPNSDNHECLDMGDRYLFESRLIWECQRHLSRKLNSKGMHETPKRPVDVVERREIFFYLSLLLILSFPTVATRTTLDNANDIDKETTISLVVQPLLGPQPIAVMMQFKDVFEKVIIRFTEPGLHDFVLRRLLETYIHGDGRSSASTELSMEWQDWFDSYDGRMEAWGGTDDEEKSMKSTKPPEEYAVQIESSSGDSAEENEVGIEPMFLPLLPASVHDASSG